MIKVNLLESVTDRPKGVAFVEKKVSNPRTRTLVLVVTVFTLMGLAMAFNYLTTRSANLAAQKELENQQRTAAMMTAVKKEQAELEQKTKDVQARIDAIQKLRASQRGPGMVLDAIKERFASLPTLYLESLEQKGGDIVIKGSSPNEATVTQFGRSLEFSSGLFTNLNIETQRKTLEFSTNDAPATGNVEAVKAAKPETVSFTIKCSYTAPQPQPSNSSNPTPAPNQVAQNAQK